MKFIDCRHVHAPEIGPMYRHSLDKVHNALFYACHHALKVNLFLNWWVASAQSCKVDGNKNIFVSRWNSLEEQVYVQFVSFMIEWELILSFGTSKSKMYQAAFL